MVSIILINYNTLAFTRACIRSIYKNCNADFEIIVVDNASDKDDIMELKTEFPGLLILQNATNTGFSKANNAGIKIASGDHILLLNADTELLNDAVSICLEILIRDKRIGVVTAQLQYPDKSLQHCCQSFPSIGNEILEISRLHKLLPEKKRARKFLGAFFDHRESSACDWVWGTFFMFRKADLEKLKEGQLSDRFFMYGEDMEWCYQFKEAGLSCFYTAEARVIHHVGGSGFGTPSQRSRVIIRNELLFVKKYYGNSFLFLFRLLKIVKYFLLSISDTSYKEITRIYREETGH